MPEFRTKDFGKGQVIFSEGEPGRIAYILKRGCVEITVSSHRKRVKLTTFSPVTVFGEMALLLDDHMRTATATAVEESELVIIERPTFDEYVSSSPQVIATVLLALADRLKKTTVRATRVPDIFDGTSEILNLLVINNERELAFSQTVEAIASILVTGKKEIEKVLSMMQDFNLLEMKLDPLGEKAIYIADDIDFLEKAGKLDKALREYSLKEQ